MNSSAGDSPQLTCFPVKDDIAHLGLDPQAEREAIARVRQLLTDTYRHALTSISPPVTDRHKNPHALNQTASRTPDPIRSAEHAREHPRAGDALASRSEPSATPSRTDPVQDTAVAASDEQARPLGPPSPTHTDGTRAGVHQAPSATSSTVTLPSAPATHEGAQDSGGHQSTSGRTGPEITEDLHGVTSGWLMERSIDAYGQVRQPRVLLGRGAEEQAEGAIYRDDLEAIAQAGRFAAAGAAERHGDSGMVRAAAEKAITLRAREVAEKYAEFEPAVDRGGDVRFKEMADADSPFRRDLKVWVDSALRKQELRRTASFEEIEEAWRWLPRALQSLPVPQLADRIATAINFKRLADLRGGGSEPATRQPATDEPGTSQPATGEPPLDDALPDRQHAPLRARIADLAGPDQLTSASEISPEDPVDHEFNSAQPQPSQDVRAMFGIELELPDVNVPFYARGVVLLRGSSWHLKTDRPARPPYDRSNLEFVLDPMVSMTDVESALQQIIALVERMRQRALTDPARTFRLADVADPGISLVHDTAVTAHDLRFEARLQTTHGISLPDLHSAVARLLPKDQRMRILDVSSRINALFAERHGGKALGPGALGLIHMTVMYLERARSAALAASTAQLSVKTAFRLMARSDFTSVHDRLLTDQERNDIDTLLLPPADGEMPDLMRVMGYEVGDRIFSFSYLVSDDGTRHEGPGVADWLRSIVHGRGEGKYKKDLLSPPPGWPLHSGDLRIDRSMGPMGVDVVNQQVLFEVRGAPGRPLLIPLNGSAIPALAREYADAMRYNPSLAVDSRVENLPTSALQFSDDLGNYLKTLVKVERRLERLNAHSLAGDPRLSWPGHIQAETDSRLSMDFSPEFEGVRERLADLSGAWRRLGQAWLTGGDVANVLHDHKRALAAFEQALWDGDNNIHLGNLRQTPMDPADQVFSDGDETGETSLESSDVGEDEEGDHDERDTVTAILAPDTGALPVSGVPHPAVAQVFPPGEETGTTALDPAVLDGRFDRWARDQIINAAHARNEAAARREDPTPLPSAFAGPSHDRVVLRADTSRSLVAGLKKILADPMNPLKPDLRERIQNALDSHTRTAEGAVKQSTTSAAFGGAERVPAAPTFSGPSTVRPPVPRPDLVIDDAWLNAWAGSRNWTTGFAVRQYEQASGLVGRALEYPPAIGREEREEAYRLSLRQVTAAVAVARAEAQSTGKGKEREHRSGQAFDETLVSSLRDIFTALDIFNDAIQQAVQTPDSEHGQRVADMEFLVEYTSDNTERAIPGLDAHDVHTLYRYQREVPRAGNPEDQPVYLPGEQYPVPRQNGTTQNVHGQGSQAVSAMPASEILDHDAGNAPAGAVFDTAHPEPQTVAGPSGLSRDKGKGRARHHATPYGRPSVHAGSSSVQNSQQSVASSNVDGSVRNYASQEEQERSELLQQGLQNLGRLADHSWYHAVDHGALPAEPVGDALSPEQRDWLFDDLTETGRNDGHLYTLGNVLELIHLGYGFPLRPVELLRLHRDYHRGVNIVPAPAAGYDALALPTKVDHLAILHLADVTPSSAAKAVKIKATTTEKWRTEYTDGRVQIRPRSRKSFQNYLALLTLLVDGHGLEGFKEVWYDRAIAHYAVQQQRAELQEQEDVVKIISPRLDIPSREEYKGLLTLGDITQAEAARIVGIAETKVSYWYPTENQERPRKARPVPGPDLYRHLAFLANIVEDHPQQAELLKGIWYDAAVGHRGVELAQLELRLTSTEQQPPTTSTPQDRRAPLTPGTTPIARDERFPNENTPSHLTVTPSAWDMSPLDPATGLYTGMATDPGEWAAANNLGNQVGATPTGTDDEPAMDVDPEAGSADQGPQGLDGFGTPPANDLAAGVVGSGGGAGPGSALAGPSHDPMVFRADASGAIVAGLEAVLADPTYPLRPDLRKRIRHALDSHNGAGHKPDTSLGARPSPRSLDIVTDNDASSPSDTTTTAGQPLPPHDTVAFAPGVTTVLSVEATMLGWDHATARDLAQTALTVAREQAGPNDPAFDIVTRGHDGIVKATLDGARTRLTVTGGTITDIRVEPAYGEPDTITGTSTPTPTPTTGEHPAPPVSPTSQSLERTPTSGGSPTPFPTSPDHDRTAPVDHTTADTTPPTPRSRQRSIRDRALLARRKWTGPLEDSLRLLHQRLTEPGTPETSYTTRHGSRALVKHGDTYLWATVVPTPDATPTDNRPGTLVWRNLDMREADPPNNPTAPTWSIDLDQQSNLITPPRQLKDAQDTNFCSLTYGADVKKLTGPR